MLQKTGKLRSLMRELRESYASCESTAACLPLIHTYIYVYIYTYRHLQKHICIYIYIYVYKHICIYEYLLETNANSVFASEDFISLLALHWNVWCTSMCSCPVPIYQNLYWRGPSKECAKSPERFEENGRPVRYLSRHHGLWRTSQFQSWATSSHKTKKTWQCQSRAFYGCSC